MSFEEKRKIGPCYNIHSDLSFKNVKVKELLNFTETGIKKQKEWSNSTIRYEKQ